MNRIVFISFVCVGLVSMSVSADSLNAELAKCAKIQDSLARLVCFDDLAKMENIPLVTKKQPATANPLVNKDASFGAEHLKKTKAAEDDLQVVFVVKKLKKDQYGKWRFTFENGQQWKQSDSGYFKLKVGESVLLKKGVLDSIFLKKNDANSNRKIRVKRIK